MLDKVCILETPEKAVAIDKILPAEFPETKGRIMCELLGDDKILVRYFNYINGKLNPRIPIAVTFSRSLKIDETTGAFVGLILTEGLRSRRNECRSRFILMNCDLDVIKFCYDFLVTKLNVSKKICLFKLYYPPTCDAQKVEKVKAEIKAKLALPGILDIPSYQQKDLKQPKVGLYVNRSIFRLVTDCIIEKTLCLIESDERFRIGFLRGVFVAEGSIELQNTGSLHFVYISQYNDKIRAIIKRALDLSGVRFSEKLQPRTKDLRISHLENFEKLHELNMCSISRTKLQRFESGWDLLRKSHHAGTRPNQTRRKILELLKNEGPLTIAQMALKLGKSYYTIWDHVRRSSHGSKKAGLYWGGLLKFKNKNNKERSWSV
jgi:DNA-binding transcriptional ArsR family regulator